MTRFFYNDSIDIGTSDLDIANGATTSDPLDLKGKSLVGIIIPSAFTGASISFTASVDGTNYYPIYNSDNNAFSITVGTSRHYMLNPADFTGCRYVKIVSASSEGAARTLLAVTRNFV